jgi:hypothetical protein
LFRTSTKRLSQDEERIHKPRGVDNPWIGDQVETEVSTLLSYRFKYYYSSRLCASFVIQYLACHDITGRHLLRPYAYIRHNTTRIVQLPRKLDAYHTNKARWNPINSKSTGPSGHPGPVHPMYAYHICAILPDVCTYDRQSCQL